ncbi:hypothetical protein [Nonomuraea maheshkhaliensis]|uniref:hypothetical protein n=1 Tax=Nonomuraea maheshkhaliensis TaxID=419590 RepID=UPI0031F83687
MDIDVHEIPANPAKPEPAHWHADFRFAFWVKDTPITLQAEEVSAFGWRSPADLPTVRHRGQRRRDLSGATRCGPSPVMARSRRRSGQENFVFGRSWSSSST